MKTLTAVILSSLLFLAALSPRAADAAHPDDPKVLGWFTVTASQITPAVLDAIAAQGYNGVIYDNRHNGISDDVLHSARTRGLMPDAAAFAASAKARGVTDVYWRLNGCTYGADTGLSWDVFHEPTIVRMEAEITQAAIDAKAAGFAGLNIDWENYNCSSLWEQWKVNGRTEVETTARYFDVGRRVQAAYAAAWPGGRLLSAPGLAAENGPTEAYWGFQHFTAGNVAGLNGTRITFVDERTMYVGTPSYVTCVYGYARGSNTINCDQGAAGWLPIKALLAARGLWGSYLAHTDTAVGLWPIDLAGAPRYPLADFRASAQAAHDLGAPYVWIFDQRGDGGMNFALPAGSQHGTALAQVFGAGVAPSPAPATPVATVVPTATPVPTATVVPTATIAPTATTDPTATVVPTATTDPTATVVPTATTDPTVTVVPTATTTPEPTPTTQPTAPPDPTAPPAPAAIPLDGCVLTFTPGTNVFLLDCADDPVT